MTKLEILTAVKKAPTFERPIDVVRFLEALGEVMDRETLVDARMAGSMDSVRHAQGRAETVKQYGLALGYLVDRLLGRPLPEATRMQPPTGHGYNGE